MEGKEDMIRTAADQKVFDFLDRNKIINLNIRGIIHNNPDAEIYVDDENGIKGILVRNGFFYSLYTEQEDILNHFLDKISQDQDYIGFSGVHRPVTEMILKRFRLDWRNPCDIYYLPVERYDPGLRKNPTQPVRLEDAEIVDKFYTFRSETSLEQIKKDISLRHSSAVYVNGEIASWVLTHDDNSMGIMYTREEYRRRGFAVDVTIDLAGKIIKSGHIPFVQILESNTQSPGLALKCGFVKAGKCDWFGVEVRS